jgi:aquaporin Z
MRKYTAEFIGTFALVFCGTGAIVIDHAAGGVVTHTGVAITFGLIVMAMIYSVGDISGAHLNPAVSIAFSIAKKFPRKEVVPYLLAQCSGALFASFLLHLLFPGDLTLGSTFPAGSYAQSFILEVILSFFLMFVILSVSHGAKESGLFAGIAVGSVVLLEAQFAGPVSGASMNPARSLAPALVSGNLSALWIYMAAPVCGAALSVPVMDYLRKKEKS